MMTGIFSKIQRAALNAFPRAAHHLCLQRHGHQPGEVRVRRLGAGFSWATASPRHRTPQRPGHFILTIINLRNVCVYAAHFPAEILNSRCCENLANRPELNIFP